MARQGLGKSMGAREDCRLGVLHPSAMSQCRLRVQWLLSLQSSGLVPWALVSFEHHPPTHTGPTHTYTLTYTHTQTHFVIPIFLSAYNVPLHGILFFFLRKYIFTLKNLCLSVHLFFISIRDYPKTPKSPFFTLDSE